MPWYQRRGSLRSDLPLIRQPARRQSTGPQTSVTDRSARSLGGGPIARLATTLGHEHAPRRRPPVGGLVVVLVLAELEPAVHAASARAAVRVTRIPDREPPFEPLVRERETDAVPHRFVGTEPRAIPLERRFDLHPRQRGRG